jgi:ATP-dependent protease ClpP protease subunit
MPAVAETLRCEKAIDDCRRVLERHVDRPMTPAERREWLCAEMTLDLEITNLVKAREADGIRWKSWEDRVPQRRQLTSYDSQQGKPTVWLYGNIGAQFDGITAADFVAELNAIGNDADIELRIHSSGGGLHEGLAMRAALLRRTGHTHVIVDGLAASAASAASVVAMGGDRISMADGAWLMIHRVNIDTGGDADDLRDAASKLDQHDAELLAIYRGRWTGSEESLRAAFFAETYFNTDDAILWGLADDVLSRLAVAACIDPERYGYRKHRIPSVLCSLRNSADAVIVNNELRSLRLRELEIEELASL